MTKAGWVASLWMALLVAGAVYLLMGPEPQGLALDKHVLQGGGHPFAIVAADLDGDGHLDLAVSNPKVSKIAVHWGLGDGNFEAPPLLFPTGERPRGVVAADFDADGLLDLAVGATGQSAVVVHRNRGDRVFGRLRAHRVRLRPFMIHATDLNEDGHVDLLAANEGEITTGRALSILLGDGRGSFKPAVSYASGKWASDVASADFNEDGHMDVAISTWGTNDVNIHYGRGDGTVGKRNPFTYQRGHGIYRVLTADLNNDQHADMVWNDLRRDGVYVLYGDGKGEFPETVLLPAGSGVRDARVGDLNADGWLDLVSANTGAGTVSVILSDGRGSYLRTQNYETGRFPRTVAVADLNGDQRLDLAVANMMSNDVTILLNRGPAPLQPSVTKTREGPTSELIPSGPGPSEQESKKHAHGPVPSREHPNLRLDLDDREPPEPLWTVRLKASWEHRFRSGSDANAAYGLVVAPDGTFYVIGDVGTGADWRVMHFDADGKELWRYEFDSKAVDVPYGMTLTADGQLVGGGTLFGRRSTRALVISISLDGEENWRYESENTSREIMRGIVSDSQSNLYLAGDEGGRWKVISLTAQGTPRWTYRGPRGTAEALAIDAQGDLTVVGEAERNWHVIRLDSAGVAKWESTIGQEERPAAVIRSRAYGVSVSEQGEAWVTGNKTARGGFPRVEKLTADGSRVWEYVGGRAAGAIARSVDLDSRGHALVAGEYAGDWLMLELDPQGQLLWRSTFDAGGSVRNPDRIHAVRWHPSGDFIAAGVIHTTPPRPPSLGPVSWRIARYQIQREDAQD